MNEPNKCVFCGATRAKITPVEDGFIEETDKKWDSVIAVYISPVTDHPTAVVTVCPACRGNKIDTLYGAIIEGVLNENQKIIDKAKKGVKEW